MYKTLTLAILLNLLFTYTGLTQTPFRVMSYNVENLFDAEKSTDKDDSEFLPSAPRHWTNGRYYHKLQQISKVITAAGEWDTPALVGLCEVENDSVIYHLLHRTPLRHQSYRYCLTNSKDPRGIQNALLYQRDKFHYINQHSHAISFTGKGKTSRDILHVYGEIITGDTLDVFVCHFPSRYGGEKESEQDRIEAAAYLKAICDSLYQVRHFCQIIIMGDFNDTPEDKSLRVVLNTSHLPENSIQDKETFTLYNLFAKASGSHKYQGKWSQIDHIIISNNLSHRFRPQSARVFSPPFLLTEDKTWHGKRPFRTYHGYKYEGGYSDHLPLLADFIF